MTDRPEPKCPWCGHAMMVGSSVLSNEVDFEYWYYCDRCWAQSPVCDDTLSAYAAAMKRAEPPRTPVDLADVAWLGVPYFAEYKGVDKLLLYVTGNGINTDFAAAHELGWKGKTLDELMKWESEHGALKLRLWEAKNSPPTDAERAAAPWKEADHAAD